MRFLSLFFFFIISFNAIAQTNFQFEENDYQSILQKSKAEQKPIFLMLYASWCPHCNKMKNEALKDLSVTNLLSKNYICVWKDTDSEEGKLLKAKFNITSLPTFIFLDSNENEVYRLKGEFKTAAFISEIQNSLNPKQQLPYLENIFLADPSNAQKWLNYMEVLKKGSDRINLSEKANTYLKTQTETQLVSETNWRIISNCVTDISSREFQYVLQHKAAFETISSPLRVERKITNIVSELLEPFTETLDTINYYKQRKIAQTVHTQKTDSLIFTYDLTLAERSLNWGLYQRSTLEGVEKYVWNSDNKLKEIGQVYLKNITDNKALKKAIEWGKRAIELNNSADGNLLLAGLYLKINDKKSGIKFAQNAKKFATQMGWSTKEADDLLKQLNAK